MPFVPRPFLVVDQNAFRKPALLDPAIERVRREDLHLLISDQTWTENIKNMPHAEETLRRTLKPLAKDLDKVFVSKAKPMMMNEELNSGTAVQDLVDHPLTDRARQLISDLAADKTGLLRTGALVDAHTAATAQYLDHSKNTANLQSFVEAWRKALGDENLKALRTKEEPYYNVASFQSLLSCPQVKDQCTDALEAAGYDRTNAEPLAATASVSSHNFLTCLGYGLRRAITRATLPPIKITNELIDADYVILASLCVGIVSEEKDVNEMWENIQAVAHRRES